MEMEWKKREGEERESRRMGGERRGWRERVEREMKKDSKTLRKERRERGKEGRERRRENDSER